MTWAYMWHQNWRDPIVIRLSRPLVVNANREKDPEKKECGKYHQIKKHSLPSLKRIRPRSSKNIDVENFREIQKFRISNRFFIVLSNLRITHTFISRFLLNFQIRFHARKNFYYKAIQSSQKSKILYLH